MLYIVSHYHQNPRQNTRHEFSDYRKANAEYMRFHSDDSACGLSWLEIAGPGAGINFKCREWNRTRGRVYGQFAKHTQQEIAQC